MTWPVQSGRFHVVSKGTNQKISGSGPVDGGTLLRFVDPSQSIDTDRFSLPVGQTVIWLQFQCVFASTPVSDRPTWLQFEVARFKSTGLDMTGKHREHITQPGTTTFPCIYGVPEYVNEDDGDFGITVTHNGPKPITVQVNILKPDNPDAARVYDAGGLNKMSK